ncbi:CASP-like protein 5c1 [Phtheirospermum japonicum]|uniref:CASP-like protein n=1 Tax=Phtheirospermum japonicum TaxID=374723 RepID=A0A830BK37_9LAMI|nr:CASP-like protein 5c1 [Phtheirospermum japonicum]
MSLGAGFYSYTAFCFLVTIMGLVIPWSLTLAILDGYSIVAKFNIRQSGVLQVIIIGDSVLSILTLAAASSTASIVDLLLKADVSFCPQKLCRNYQISAATAFSSWLLLSTSLLSNLWLLPSLEAD